MLSFKELGWKKTLMLVLTLISVALLISLIFVFFVFLVVKFGSKENEIASDEEFTYRFFRFDPKTGTSSTGFTTILEELPDNGFVSFQDIEGGNLNLISNFGSEEFLCTGNCYCESNSERRSSTALPVYRGMMYLAAALSSSVAIGYATKYFNEECASQMEDVSCNSDSVRSEVENCELVNSYTKMSEDAEGKPNIKVVDGSDRTGDSPTFDQFQNEFKDEKFMCRGTCLQRDLRSDMKHFYDNDGTYPEEHNVHQMSEHDKDLFKDNIDYIHEQGERFKCETLELHIGITAAVHPKEPRPDQEKIAAMEYMMNHLHPFCSKESMKPTHLRNKWGPDFQTELAVCTSHHLGANPSVKCVQVKQFVDKKEN